MKKIYDFRKNGSVTLFAVLIFMIVVAVVTVTIHSARVNGARVFVSTASQMAMDSLFSSYDKDLFSKYGVLLFDGRMGNPIILKADMEGVIEDYLLYNLEPASFLKFFDYSDLLKIDFRGISITDILYASDSGGLIWQDMVVDYEKYAKPIDMAAGFFGIADSQEEADEVENISEQIIECTSQVVEINNMARELIQYIDGVICTKNGLNFEKLEVSQNYLKKFGGADISMKGMHINNSQVYEAVSNNIFNPYFKMEEAKSYLKEEKYVMANKSLKEIAGASKNALTAIDEALSIIEKIESESESFISDLDGLQSLILSDDNSLDEETKRGLQEEMGNLSDFQVIMAKDICDISTMKTVLQRNRDCLNEMNDRIKSANPGDDSTDEDFAAIENNLRKYTLTGIEFNYEHLGCSESDTSILDELTDFLHQGILALIVPKDKTVSGREIKVDNLSSDYVESPNTWELTKNMDEVTKTTKKIVYNEYVFDKFNSFSDEKSGPALDYEIEYILCGKESDEANLTLTAEKIALVRSGINMVYLLTDTEKKQAAYKIAATLVGSTGIEPLVRVTQFSLLYIWAYAEGLADVSVLLDGGKVSLKKTRETWHLSLENLLAFSLESDKKGEQEGLKYNDYLRFLLFFEDMCDKSLNTMDLVELDMISSGRKSFRLYYYVYGIEMNTTYQVKGISKNYMQHEAYTY